MKQITRRLHLIAGAVPFQKFPILTKIIHFANVVKNSAPGEPQRSATNTNCH